MKSHLATLVLLGVSLQVFAAEDWRQLYEDAAVTVAVNVDSLGDGERIRMFRERESLRQPELDQASMRKVQEKRYLRQADCASRQLRTLSHIEFSEHGVLVFYEARQPGAANWQAPHTAREIRLLEAMCGPA